MGARPACATGSRLRWVIVLSLDGNAANLFSIQRNPYGPKSAMRSDGLLLPDVNQLLQGNCLLNEQRFAIPHVAFCWPPSHKLILQSCAGGAGPLCPVDHRHCIAFSRPSASAFALADVDSGILLRCAAPQLAQDCSSSNWRWLVGSFLIAGGMCVSRRHCNRGRRLPPFPP